MVTNDIAFICAVKTRKKKLDDVITATGISRQSMNKKRKNERDFKANEIKSIMTFLNLSVDEMMSIFFADEVD